MKDRFEDKVVIVTGAASGIGEATARRFSAEGAKVVLVDRQREALEKVAGELPSDRTLAHVADVSNSRAVDDMVASTVKRFGRLDVLVNNAGVHEGGDPSELTDEQWRKVMATDADGVFFGCRAAIPHLEKTKGSIVNTASVSGTGGDWSMSPYNAAKGAVVNLTRALAMDLGKKGVRVNSVCPSLTRTGMTTDMMDDKELLSKFAERIPLGRVCEPQEVAAVIAFLASDDASFMTGANVAVDGGVSASNGQPPQQ
jgi:meso-butanediol dehydrogenase/(S,S)-butanediol dehydrogenase/diacetyl reductase